MNRFICKGEQYFEKSMCIGFSTFVVLISCLTLISPCCSTFPLGSTSIFLSFILFGIGFCFLYEQQLTLPSSQSNGYSHSFADERESEIAIGVEKALQDPLDVKIFNKIECIPREDWSLVTQDRTIFLSTSYLQGLALSPPKGMQFRYVLVYEGCKPVGAAYFQLLEVDFTHFEIKKTFLQIWRWPLAFLLGGGSERSGIRMLLCGNFFSSGEAGYCFDPDWDQEKALEVINHLVKRISEQESGRAVDLLALKDFPETKTSLSNALQADGYLALKFQPRMVLHLREEWETFEDYLKAMSSKYRQRAKSVRKKGKKTSKHSFDSANISRHLAKIQELFHAVTSRSDFHITTISPHSFVHLKENLKEDFELTSYEVDGVMVGFSIALVTTSELDGYLVGLDYQANRSHAIYQNMLYDFVSMGIERGCQSVQLGRTALEIKSTIGAEAEELLMFVRHTNDFKNKFIKPFAALIPETKWTPRQPFKKKV